MISNNDMIIAMKITHNTREKCLSNNVLHNEHINGRVVPLRYLFKWRYKPSFSTGISFRANLVNGG